LDRSRSATPSLLRSIAALTLAAGGLLPAACPALAGQALPVEGAPPAPAISQCVATLWCAQFTVSLFSSGSGSVVSNTNGIADGHIDCVLTNGVQSATGCSYLYTWPAGTGTFHITLDAIPAMGSYVCFQNGTCLKEGYSTPLAIDLTNGVPSTYAIDFQAALRTLTVTTVFTGGGSALHAVKATNIESIDCPPTCTWQYPYGTAVTLEAQYPDGWGFIGGFYACQGSDPTCHVTMTDDLSAGFNFFPIAVVTSRPTPSPAATAHQTAAPTSGPGGTQSASATGDTTSPTPSDGATTAAGLPSPASTGGAAGSTVAATGADPIVIGLLVVIAALLVVLAIGILAVTRRRRPA